MTRSRRRLRGAVRLARLGVFGGALAGALAACTCPAPTHLDQLFLLDARPGAPLVALDAGADAMSIDPGSDAGAVSDAASPAVSTLDCTSTAVGCAPGGDCLPACNCVLARGGLQRVAAIDGCQLVAGAAAPTVEVRYEVKVFCPGD
jgi:hypothetical protein